MFTVTKLRVIFDRGSISSSTSRNTSKNVKQKQSSGGAL